MKKLLLSLATIILSTGYCIAQDKPYMTLTTSKGVGERIQFTITSNGGFTLEGVEETEGIEGYSGYTLTSSEIKLIGDITSFSAPYVSITSADISTMPGMEIFDVFGNPITNITLKGNKALTSLTIGNTSLTSLDITDCSALEYLNINSSKIASLDLSGSGSLVTLLAKASGLQQLNLKGADNLEVLDCSYNNLGTVDISSTPSIQQLSCAGNDLYTLNLSKNSLIVLNCNVNNLSSLDLSNQKNLEELGCVNNKLETIDFTPCTKLFGVMAYGNIIFDKGMTSLVESLPMVKGDAGYFTIVDYSTDNERNEMSVYNVKKAAEKNWITYDYQNQEMIEYEGMPNELLAIDDVNATSLNVYHSTANNNIYVSGIAEGTSIAMYDMTGKEVYSTTAQRDVTIINATVITDGIYVIRAGKESVKISL